MRSTKTITIGPRSCHTSLIYRVLTNQFYLNSAPEPQELQFTTIAHFPSDLKTTKVNKYATSS